MHSYQQGWVNNYASKWSPRAHKWWEVRWVRWWLRWCQRWLRWSLILHQKFNLQSNLSPMLTGNADLVSSDFLLFSTHFGLTIVSAGKAKEAQQLVLVSVQESHLSVHLVLPLAVFVPRFWNKILTKPALFGSSILPKVGYHADLASGSFVTQKCTSFGLGFCLSVVQTEGPKVLDSVCLWSIFGLVSHTPARPIQALLGHQSLTQDLHLDALFLAETSA